MFSEKFVSAGREYSTLTKMVPAPYMRRNVTVAEKPVSAKICICGLGFYDLFINGARITKGILAPYISNPDDILYYDEYEFADRLNAGENTIGIMLGNGMLNCPGGDIWDFQKARFRSAPKVAFHCVLTFADGSVTEFEADENVICAPSPVYYDDLRVGEFCDARKEIPGWAEPGLDTSAWTPAIPAETPRGIAKFCEAEPIVTRKELKPVSIRRAKIGPDPNFRNTLPVIEPEGDEAVTEGWLYDFGENCAGNGVLRICGKRGQKIILQYCEKLDENGDIDLRPMNFLPKALNHRDIYICKGEGIEEFTDVFAYHGFRYCLVIGLEDAQATEDLLSCRVMSTKLTVHGGFTCSNEMLNKVQEAVIRADLSNFYYFPTDCPHREKNGWTGDAAFSTEQMLINITPENSYREWMNNIRRAQREDGALPGIIPTSGWGFAWGNGPAYDCIIAYIPYFMWKYRGDTKIITENACAIMRYLHYIMTKRDSRGLIHIGLGDWVPSAHINKPIAPLEVTDTLICMDICAKSEKIFKAVNMLPEAAYAKAVYEAFRASAREYLVDWGTMTVEGGCQTTQAMGIFYNLFEEGEKQSAFKVLEQMVLDNEGLMDVGILGGRVIFHVLSKFGRTDLAYNMAATERYPSYVYTIMHGATTLWEDFHPDGCRANSLNHHFWGDISHWMIESLAGININPHDRNHLEAEIHPRFVKELDSARGCTDINGGSLSSEWKRDGAHIILTVSCPEGVTGSIKLDRDYKFENGARFMELKSGTYTLISAKERDSLYIPEV